MKSLSYFIMVFAIPFCVVSFAQAVGFTDMTDRTPMDSAPENLVTIVTGEVKDVQGEWCFVHDSQGTEWKIQVDQYTDTIGQVLPGVTIIAMVEGGGHAKEVKVIPE